MCGSPNRKRLDLALLLLVSAGAGGDGERGGENCKMRGAFSSALDGVFSYRYQTDWNAADVPKDASILRCCCAPAAMIARRWARCSATAGFTAWHLRNCRRPASAPIHTDAGC